MAGKPPEDQADSLWRTGPIWIASDRRLARYVARPIANFLRVESAGGLVLLAATVVALVWANSPWSDAYHTLWATEIQLRIGDFVLGEDLQHWINDGLMVVFFFVVGLEIKYEMVAGELRNPRAAVVPIAAAFGGMLVPAAVYAALNAGGPGADGWGVPMATDIAFALGVVALLGRRIPSAARVFLLTLAIVDDIGAITVIGIFYTANLSLGWLAAAVLGLLGVVALRLMRVWSVFPYLVVGLFVWLATYESGVHATIAGVLLGLLTPARSLLDHDVALDRVRQGQPEQLDIGTVERGRFLLNESVPVAARLGHVLHPWSSYVVLPIFALANAGIDLRGGVLGDLFGSSVTVGIVLGLVLGKTVGVFGVSWLAIRLGLGQLPVGSNWSMLSGLAVLSGIGFTVSLFIAGLAFDPGSRLQADANLGILAGSLVAAVLGAVILLYAGRKTPDQTPAETDEDMAEQS